ncbi:prolyl oligopeptidase family serine peptidase [Streptomyces murinus]|uniref:prolyl oligopeptidase family serine peptidase n=1 Tax=Streptomyces murinus TaxID=33900 RepID=UPI003635B748
MVIPVVDYTLTHAETDLDRLVLMGYGLGGRLTARAAAHDHRLAALVVDDGLYDYYDTYTRMMPPLLREWVEACPRTR